MPAEDRLPVIKKPAVRRRSSKKLLLFLFIFFITLLLVLFFQSSLSVITRVEVDGQQLVSESSIRQASGVKPGDHFFSVSSGAIEAQVKGLHMIETVDVTKHFPGVIHIQVKEYPKVAYQIGDNGQVEVLLADASAAPVTVQGVALDMPILSGWAPDDPMKVKLCQMMASLAPGYFKDISEIKPAPTESYPDKVRMYTRSQYEVQTTIGYMPEKMKNLAAYIANLQDNKISGGVIKMLDADWHSPFDNDPSKAAKDGKGAAPAGKDGGQAKDTAKPPASASPGTKNGSKDTSRN
ncbi:FtsQ-type POTRA domain-containing protein [Paenibacillus filicis]|uniref:FtsQ-type POTRA domain-containing protein n=1 Tax=Paenibacillus gyeongsangnamensis TaxID=3388067 RepID=A0ABT4Q390_9BACL|nr:FtsQ-type POTRA domain-containing protein [Paenibacillus filicis]MCZ8511237.1 FtsQ-type POTRA domain-containing protein [Paenibacillus filicis]